MLTTTTAAPDIDLAAYADRYEQNVRKLVESKVKGKEVIAPPPEEAPAMVINLMDALQEECRGGRKGG